MGSSRGPRDGNEITWLTKALTRGHPANSDVGGRADAVDQLRGMMLDMADIDELVLQLGHAIPTEATFVAVEIQTVDAAGDHEWLKLQDLAEVEVTSEADGYPIETVFNFGAGPGWQLRRAYNGSAWSSISRGRFVACASSLMSPTSHELRNSRCDAPATRTSL